MKRKGSGGREIETAKKFIEAINGHDLEKIFALMADDHVFIDSQGRVAKGREAMREGWKEYFRMFPDYTIRVESILGDRGLVAVFAPLAPWERAANNLALTFTGPLARSLALVAIVIGGLMFMFGEGGAKRQISGIVFGGGLALFAAQFLVWLF